MSENKYVQQALDALRYADHVADREHRVIFAVGQAITCALLAIGEELSLHRNDVIVFPPPFPSEPPADWTNEDDQQGV